MQKNNNDLQDLGQLHRINISQMVTYYLLWVLWYFKEFKNVKLDK